MRGFFYATAISLALAMTNVQVNAQGPKKLKPEEIVAKHLESIGSADAFAAIKTRIATGSATARKVNSPIDTTVRGTATVASSLDSLVFDLKFEMMNADDYGREHLSYDGKKFNIPLITAAKPSALGDFVGSYRAIVKHGFFGGVLNVNWVLRDSKTRISKMEYQGTDKVEGVEAHIVKVVPKGGSGLTIRLFFDNQYRHIRTIYYQETSPPTTLSDEGRVSSIRYKLIEDFGAFRNISGLMLPTKFKLDYLIESPSRLNEYEWVLTFSRFADNAELKPELFQ
jgi:hypothetical protein